MCKPPNLCAASLVASLGASLGGERLESDCAPGGLDLLAVS